MSARSSGSTPAFAPPKSSSALATIRTCRGLEYLTRSVTAASAADDSSGSAGRLACLEDVLQVDGRYRIRIERHDRVGQMLALVRFDPGLHWTAGGERQRADQ